MSGNRVVDGAIGGAALLGAIFFPPASIGLAAIMKSAGTSLLLQSVVGPGRRTTLPGRQEGVESNLASQQRALPVVYGQARIGVSPVDIRTLASNNAQLYIAGAICVASSDGSGIESIEAVYFDDRAAFNSAGVITGAYATASTPADMTLERHYGTDAQNVSTLLSAAFPSVWIATMRGRGIAAIVVRIKYDGQLFPNIPNITVDVRGNKLYDPRTATWVFQGIDVNPALAIYDYLTSTRYGAALGAGELDAQSFIDMANYYDELVEGATGTQARFRTRGWLDTGATVGENLTRLLSSCRGTLLYDGGKLRLFTRRPTAAVSYALSEDVIVGDWSFATPGVGSAPTALEGTFPDSAARDRPTTVRWPRESSFVVFNAFLVAPAKIRLVLTNDTVTSIEHGLVTGETLTVVGLLGLTGANATWVITVIDATTIELNGSSSSGTWTAGTGYVKVANLYTTTDGGYESVQRKDLPLTANRITAEQILNVELREQRAGTVASVTCFQSALQLRVGEVVNVTHPTPGWVAKPFWVMAIIILPDDTVRLTLSEYDSTAYTLNPRATPPGTTATAFPNPLTCIAPTNLVLANGTQRADQSTAQLLATWTDSLDPFVDRYIVQARRQLLGGAWDDFGVTLRGASSIVLAPLTPNETWEVRVIAVNSIGVQSTPLTGSRLAVLNPAYIELGTAVINSTYVEIPYTIPVDSTATIIEVWYREDDAAISVGTLLRGMGMQPAGTPLLNPSATIGGVAITGVVRFPCSPSSYVTVLFVPIDTNNRPNLLIARRQHQALAAPATPPTAPTATAFVSNATTSVTMSVTMPASIPSGAVIRTYRNGSVYGSDIAITVSGSGTQNIVYSGLAPASSFSWQHALVNSSGTSALTSAVAGNTVTGTLPTPTLVSVDSRRETATHYYFGNVTFAGGTPSGVTIDYERDEGSGYVVVRTASLSTSEEIGFTRAVGDFTGFLRVRISAPGWTTSAYSTAASCAINRLGGGTEF